MTDRPQKIHSTFPLSDQDIEDAEEITRPMFASLDAANRRLAEILADSFKEDR